MDLVTITCNRDLQQMLLQAKSVQKYLKKGTTHWIIINENKKFLRKFNWKNLLSPYYNLVGNFSNFSKEKDPNWSGHNDYLFIKK